MRFNRRSREDNAMHRISWLCVTLTILSVFAPNSIANELVEGNDVRAEPMKKAVDALVKQIQSGDFDNSKAEYAGEKADLELLKAYVDGVAAAKAMRAALVSKFGEPFKQNFRAFDTAVARMGVHDFNTVIFLDDADRASSSANSPMGVGIEFKRVNGKWKVLSLASAPNKAEDHVASLQKYISAVKDITEKVNAGKYTKAEDAGEAVLAAEDLLRPIKKKPTQSSHKDEPRQ
jgi:hypothetical protein